jgi:hypothetical protein
VKFVKRALTSFVLMLHVSMFISACATDDPAPAATPTSAATLMPTATPSLAPTSTRASGPPAVDNIINVVLRNDAAALEPLVRMTPLPCGPQQGPGSPPRCPPGQPNGTPVDVFPVASCEGELRERTAVRPTLEEVTGRMPRLTGVYRAPDPYLPAVKGDYVAVFSRQLPGQPNLGAGMVIAGDRVVGVWFGCGANPSQIVPAGTQPVHLPGG